MIDIENIFAVGDVTKPKSLLIGYSKGYEYQLEYSKAFWTPIKGYKIRFDWYELQPNGLLIIQKGYAWDGMTGWIDTPSNRVYSLIHDVFCQMMRNQQLPHIFREVNRFCKEVGKACGMWTIHTAIVTCGVNLARSGDPGRGPDRPILYSP